MVVDCPAPFTDTAALRDGTTDHLWVPQLRPDTSIDDLGSLIDGLPDGEDEDGHGPTAAPGDEQHALDADSDKDPALCLFPRSQKTFYGTILAGMRLWKRPPHNHCERCQKYTKTRERIAVLEAVLNSQPFDADYDAQTSVVDSAGGLTAAWEELRSCQHKLPDLRKHAEWLAGQRPYLKERQCTMPAWTALLWLDYGGFTDSANKKVNCWSATAITKDREDDKQEHFDFFRCC